MSLLTERSDVGVLLAMGRVPPKQSPPSNCLATSNEFKRDGRPSHPLHFRSLLSPEARQGVELCFYPTICSSSQLAPQRASVESGMSSS